MSFNTIQSSIEAILASDEFKALNIPAYPTNYQGKISGNEWVRLNVYPGNSELFFDSERVYGDIVFNIFVPAGQGMRRATTIADELKNLFGRKIISGLQTTNSFITTKGIDPVDKGLFRLDLTINFSNYT